MHRALLRSLFVAATALLLTTTACDKGGDKADDKKAPEEKTPEAVNAEAGAEADAGAEAGAPAADAGAEADAGAAADAGEVAPTDAGDEPAEGEAGAAVDADEAPAEDDGGDKPDDGGSKTDGGKSGGNTASAPKIDGKPIYDKKCKSCHGIDGKGDTTIGKKVEIPSLAKTKLGKGKVISTITNGVPDTKMKAFSDKLSKDEIEAVAVYVKKL